jgi:hypothetical protein
MCMSSTGRLKRAQVLPHMVADTETVLGGKFVLLSTVLGLGSLALRLQQHRGPCFRSVAPRQHLVPRILMSVSGVQPGAWRPADGCASADVPRLCGVRLPPGRRLRAQVRSRV